MFPLNMVVVVAIVTGPVHDYHIHVTGAEGLGIILFIYKLLATLVWITDHFTMCIK